MSRRGPTTILLALVVAILAGCGSSPPPARSASNEISDAERAIDSAKQWERKGELDLALGEYNRAKDIISKGKAFAEGTELAKLNNMEDDVRSARMKLEMAKLTIAATPKKEEKAPVAVKTEDPDEKKKKEDEAEKKKKDAKVAAAQADIKKIAELTAATTPPAKKAQADEPEPPPEPKGAKAGTKGDEKVADPDAGAIKKSAGPFPALSEKSPPIQVCKLEIKGKFALCYFQLFNAGEAGKRIMSASVFFKDGNNSPLINPLAAPVYPFDGFRDKVANLIDGQMINALSLGSQQVTGGDGLRLVGVGESERAKDIKSVAVKVVYADGTVAVATSSADAPADVPGLKALDPKK